MSVPQIAGQLRMHSPGVDGLVPVVAAAVAQRGVAVGASELDSCDLLTLAQLRELLTGHLHVAVMVVTVVDRNQGLNVGLRRVLCVDVSEILLKRHRGRIVNIVNNTNKQQTTQLQDTLLASQHHPRTRVSSVESVTRQRQEEEKNLRAGHV
eukprot:3281936-Rhodomonas_salina.1